MRDSSGGRNSVSQPFLELPRLRPTKAQRLSDWTINRIAQPRCLARLGSPELIQKSGDAISRVFAKTLTEDLDRATARVLIHSGLFSSSIASAIWLYPDDFTQR